MAVSGTKLVFLFLLLSLASLPTQARVSEFFSRFMRYNAAPTSTQLPAADPVQTVDPRLKDDPSKLNPESQNGYGLYGGSAYNRLPADEEFPPGEKVDPTAEEFRFRDNVDTPAEEFHVGKNGYPAAEEFHVGKDGYPAAEEFHVGKNGYPAGASRVGSAKRFDPSATEFEFDDAELAAADPARRSPTDRYQYSGEKAAPAGRYPANGNDPARGYGMSDTRFLENGRYFYDVKKDGEYGGRYGSEEYRYRRNPSGYEYDSYQKQNRGQEEYPERYTP